MLAGFKKIAPPGRRPEMLLINKNEKKYRKYTALSKRAVDRAEGLKLGYVEILINEKTRELAIKPVSKKDEYSTRITKTHRIAIEHVWEQLKERGFSIKSKYKLKWSENSACWIAEL